MTSVVTLDLEGVPLKTTLRLALKQLDLAYCVRDGVLIISSVPGISAELSEAESERCAKIRNAVATCSDPHWVQSNIVAPSAVPPGSTCLRHR